MIERLRFVLPGEPVAKGRPRFYRAGPYVKTYTPRETVDYERAIKVFARMAMGRNPRMFEGPLRVVVSIGLPIPQSWSKLARERAMIGLIMPTVRPDVDNYAKIALDGMTGLVFGDDAAVVWLETRKAYALRPHMEIVVEELEGALLDRRAVTDLNSDGPDKEAQTHKEGALSVGDCRSPKTNRKVMAP
jgi:Holliday junction resolvase RusA-like endonuclease